MLEIPGQVAEIHELERAGAQQVAEALAVLAAVLWLRLEGRAQRIGAGIRERGGQELTVGGDDDELDSVSASRSPGLTVRRRAPATARYWSRRAQTPVRVLVDALAVIDEGADLHAFRERGEPTDVVGVKVGDEEVVEPRQPRLLGDDVLDARRVAVAEPRKPGVHQHRLPLRRHDQRGRAPFDVDPIDVQRARHRGCQDTDGQRHGEQDTECELAELHELHVSTPSTVPSSAWNVIKYSPLPPRIRQP